MKITSTLIFVMVSLATVDAQVITSGPNKGRTVESVVLSRLEGARELIKAAQEKTNEAQYETRVVQSKYDIATNTIAVVTGQRDWWQNKDAGDYAWGLKSEKAVKGLAVLFALVGSLYLGSMLAGVILKNFPSFEGPIASAIVYALVFLGLFYPTVTCIYVISPYIPAPPLWHDVVNVFHKMPVKIPTKL